MKYTKSLLIVLLLLLVNHTIKAQNDIYFSKYVEGSGYDKALELYNPTNNTIDLSNYEISIDTDGLGWGEGKRTFTHKLKGKLPPKTSYLMVREVSKNEELKFLADTTLRSNILNFNGNEQILLTKLNTREGHPITLDKLGYPGSTYNMRNMTLVRKSHTAPNYGNVRSQISYEWDKKSYTNLSCLKLAPGSSNLGVSVDKSKTVGSIVGSANVSATGAAIYSIPVPVLAGINGLEPNLTVVYNSQGGDGLLGRGWNLSGLSAITRVPQTIYHDGKASGIGLNSEDRLALDGNRLIATSGSYGASNTQYRTEIETFSKITALGSGLSSHFKVETKDGRVLEYGSSNGSRVTFGGESQPLMWYLNKVTDQNGNTIVFNYSHYGGASWIENIQYSGNTVQFTYSTNRYPITRFVKGHKVITTKILTNIQVKRNGKLLYGYRLNYNKNSVNHTDELSTITKYNGNGKELNPTVIKWKKDYGTIRVNNVSAEHAYLKNSFDDQIYTSGDTDGDGVSELIGWFSNPEGTNYIAEGYQVYQPAILSNGSISMKRSQNYSIFNPSYNLDNLKNFNLGFYCADLYGDGTNNLILPQWLHSSGNKVVFNIMDVKNANNVVAYIETPELDKRTLPLFTVADLNKNGKAEIVYIQTSTENTGVFKGEIIEKENTGARKQFSLSLRSGNQNKGVPERMFVTDLTSDGNPDLMVITKEGSFVFKGNGTSFTNEGTFISNLKDCKLLKQGDFNGDGISDFLFSADGGSTMKFAYSKGNGSFDVRTYSDILGLDDGRTSHDDDEDNIFIVDFNNDGRSDFISINSIEEYDGHWVGHDYDYVRTEVKHYESTGYGFKLIRSNTFKSETYSNKKFFISGDFNGDGRVDILNYGYPLFNSGSNSIGWHYTFSPNEEYAEGLVTEISNGFKANTKFSYAPLTSSIYEKGKYDVGEKINGVINFQGALYVTKSLKLSDGLQGDITNIYKYKKAKVHLTGKGFLGFLETKSTNLSTQKVENRFIELDCDNYDFMGMNDEVLTALKKIEVKTTSGQLISSVEHRNKFKSLGNKRIFPYVDQTIQTDGLKDITVTSTFNYDSYGNVTNQTSNYASDATVKVSNTYSKYGAWCPSRLTSSISTTTYSGEPAFSVTGNYKYYNNGNLKSEESNGITTSYTYDSYGNLDIVTISASGESSRTTNYDYDATHRFVSKITDGLKQVESYQYNDWGKVTHHTDIAGNTTGYRYNDWGQLGESMNPDGNMTEYRTSWADNNNTGALYYAYTKTEGSAYVKTFYDMLGREIGSETEGFNGKVYTSQKYNKKGLAVSSLSPHYSGGTIILSRTSYDIYDRPKSIDVNGVKTTYSYSGLKNTVSSPSGYYTKTFNAMGKLVASTDRVGSISYKYHSSGQTKSITSNKNTVSMTYYPNGLQKTLSDPDAGTITYVYNGFGELKTQTDNKGNITSIKYDDAGRIQKKTCGTFSSDYKYYTSGKQIGLLESVKNSNSTESYYQYNNYGQPILVREKIEGKTFDTSYSYDDYGRVNSIAYPSGFTVSQAYNSNGYLDEVRRADNGKRIWKASRYNAMGQAVSYLSGNGKLTQKSFDNDGKLTSIKTDYGKIQNLTYKFHSSTGNLMERRDRRNGRNETFTYDNLNRLKSAKHNYGDENYDYDIKGNITYKTNVGDYKYGAAQPHAVSFISNEAGLVKTNQDITYTAFNKVKTIKQGDYRMSFVYGHDYARRKTNLYENDSKVMTKYFVGNYEQKEMESKVHKISYIMGGDGLAAIHIMGKSGPEMLYVHKDHLGSIQCLSCDNTSSNNGIVEEYSYDAWGKRTYPDEPGYNNDYSYADLCRGYTGHEHLPEFGLINMNGRVYDPLIGRFLSPDNYVQMPDFTQNFNRFSYCLNNPLIYSDPSGEIVWAPIIIGAVIGAYMGGSTVNGTYNPAKWDYSDGKTWAGMGVGALAGGIGSGIGSGVIGGLSGTEAAMFGGMAAGAINGGGMTAIAGGSFNNVMGNMIQGAFVGGAAGAAGAATFQGANRFFDTKFSGILNDILPTNTLSYMAGSTASQMTANLVQGKNIFKGVDNGFNIGMILPLSIDIARGTESLKMYYAKKYNTCPDREVLSSRDIFSRTELNRNGDLVLSVRVNGQSQYPKIDYTAEGYMHGEIFNQIFQGSRSENWSVTIDPFIPYYSSYIQTIYNLKIRL